MLGADSEEGRVQLPPLQGDPPLEAGAGKNNMLTQVSAQLLIVSLLPLNTRTHVHAMATLKLFLENGFQSPDTDDNLVLVFLKPENFPCFKTCTCKSI